jgi:hypothetical protein
MEIDDAVGMAMGLIAEGEPAGLAIFKAAERYFIPVEELSREMAARSAMKKQHVSESKAKERDAAQISWSVDEGNDSVAYSDLYGKANFSDSFTAKFVKRHGKKASYPLNAAKDFVIANRACYDRNTHSMWTTFSRKGCARGEKLVAGGGEPLIQPPAPPAPKPADAGNDF